MKPKLAALLLPLACVAISGCDLVQKAKAPKAPTGQVVATVDGDEVTSRELRAELAGLTFPDANARKQAEQAALQNIISRKLLAKAAVDAGLDKTPDFALEKARADEALLAQTMQKQIAGQIPEPTDEEVASYVALHRDTYADRKIFSVDQLRMAPINDPQILKGLEPLNTLEDVQAFLTQHNIQFQRGVAQIDTLGLDPRMTEQILKLPPGEVFIVPGPQIVLVNQIRDTQVSPVPSEQAKAHAKQFLKQQRTQEALSRQLGEIQRKAAGKVQIAKDYQPPKPAPAPQAAPAAATAPAKPT